MTAGQGQAVVFGASGGIGTALARALERGGRHARVVALSRSGGPGHLPFDLEDEQSLAAAAQAIAPGGPVDLVLVATGALTIEGAGPERSMRALDPQTMARAFALNATGPALIAKHMLPLFPREGRAVFAALSARVGSIGDNRLGGWYAYRASKAALNMLIRGLAIETARTRRDAIVAALHPGTVATALSGPFQRNVPAGQLTSPETAADNLLRVIEGLAPADSGGFFAWNGQPIPY